MRVIKNVLALVGLMVVIVSLIQAVLPSSKKTEITEITQEEVKNETEPYKVVGIRLPENLEFAGEQVPLQDQEVKERAEREFLVNTYWQSNAILLMKRSKKFFPVIEPILAKNGIPDDFKYLALAESGLQNVVSPAGATGFWQIMKETGRSHGLEINENVDERYHLEKSTQAACDYLKQYKKKFGSWTLTAAVYNAGAGNISKYIGVQKENNYYDLLLGEETGRYVFRILAIKEILKSPHKYGFELTDAEFYRPIQTFKVEVDTVVSSWADFAQKYGINYKILKRHNPWLREAHLNNASRKKYVIEIPDKKAYGLK